MDKNILFYSTMHSSSCERATPEVNSYRMSRNSLKKQRQFSRLLLHTEDPQQFKAIEMRTLRAGILINALMAVAGYLGYYYSASYALAFDGNLGAIAAVSFFVALRITQKKDQRSEKYPLGLYSVENIYAFIQGILLIGISVYAILEGCANIMHFIHGHAPEPIRFWPILIYTIVMLIACAGVWLFYRRELRLTKSQSPILKSETVSAFMDTAVTFGTGIALLFVAVVPSGSRLGFLNHIGDSIIVIIISVFLIREPLKIVTHSFFSLIGRTLQNPRLRRRTENVIVTSLDPIFRLQKFHIFHIGSCYEIEVTITVVDDILIDMNLFRMSKQTMEDRLRELYPNLILEVLLE